MNDLLIILKGIFKRNKDVNIEINDNKTIDVMFDRSGYDNDSYANNEFESIKRNIKNIIDCYNENNNTKFDYDIDYDNNIIVIGNDSLLKENNDIEGKRYDWIKDFQFTDNVISDLRKRDLLQLGKNIQALVPVNRENGPTYRQPDKDGTIFNYEKGERINPTPHDLDVYDIVHVQLNFDFDNKKIGIDRYFGHRKDWSIENHTSTHRDWTDIPVLTRTTVDSLINSYRDHGVFDGLLKTIDDYIEKNVSRSVDYFGSPTHVFGDEVDSKDPEVLFKRADKRRMYREKSQNPRFLKWLNVYIQRYSNDSNARHLRKLCEEIQNGNIFNYEYDFLEPEIPSEEYKIEKFKKHQEEAKQIERSLEEYYNSGVRTGD